MCVCKRERESVSMHMNAFRSTNGHLSKEDVVVHMFSLLTLLFSFFHEFVERAKKNMFLMELRR